MKSAIAAGIFLVLLSGATAIDVSPLREITDGAHGRQEKLRILFKTVAELLEEADSEDYIKEAYRLRWYTLTEFEGELHGIFVLGQSPFVIPGSQHLYIAVLDSENRLKAWGTNENNGGLSCGLRLVMWDSDKKLLTTYSMSRGSGISQQQFQVSDRFVEPMKGERLPGIDLGYPVLIGH
ncbi:MAG: hypothetical protein AAF591_09450 [Verrucomicrobiota bacterium]